MHSELQAVVAGHTCLDIIPGIRPGCGLADLMVPGKLVDVDAAVTATGGAVANTGLALHRLGLPVRLMGKVGDDLFGEAVLRLFRRHGEALAAGMIVAPGEATSYTVVLNPPGVDRVFLHCPGANDSFCAADLPLAQVAPARLFHFGYPPLMRRMFADGGRELAALMGGVRALGVTTSLDMALPDPASPAGQADWPGILARALPHVDLFLPSFDEIQAMLRLPPARPGGERLHEIADRLLDLGCAIVGLKLGDQGLYLRTTPDRQRLAALGRSAPADPAAWTACELLAPCYRVPVVGTTGAGDCTIAGFLAAILQGLSPADAVRSATAVGACNAEAADAISGIVPWPRVQARLAAGWDRLPVHLPLPGWQWADGLAYGPGHVRS